MDRYGYKYMQICVLKHPHPLSVCMCVCLSLTHLRVHTHTVVRCKPMAPGGECSHCGTQLPVTVDELALARELTPEAPTPNVMRVMLEPGDCCRWC